MAQVIYLDTCPPSVNQCFANVRGKGRVRTERYNTWLNAASWQIKEQAPNPVSGWYAVQIIVPNAMLGRKDLDNICKPIVDLLVKNEVTPDDKHLSSLICQRDIKGEKLCVVVWESALSEE